MSFGSKVQNFAKYVVSASFLGLILGVLGLYYTLRSGRTLLVVDVAAESNVLDVRTAVKDLAILFQGRDIQQENSNLKIFTVRLTNQGEVNILETYFDSRNPWGLEVNGGRVIEARVTSSNSLYLSQNLQPKIADATHVELNKIIFDKGKFVTLELLVLHNKNVAPRVGVFGKIAGMDEIPVTNSSKEHDQQSFAKIVFRGPVAVQIARTISYFIAGLVTIIAVGFAIAGGAGAISRFRRNARRKLVRSLPREASSEREKKRKILVSIFIDEGLEQLKQLAKVLSDEKVLKATLSGSYVHGIDGPVVMDGDKALLVHLRSGIATQMEPLVKNDLVKVDGEGIRIDGELSELLSTLISQLERLTETAHDPKVQQNST